MLGHRRPVEPLDLHVFLRGDLEPLLSAWSEVWTVGSPEAVAKANSLVDAAGSLVSLNTTPDRGRSRATRVIAGETFGQDQLDAIAAASHAFAEQRRSFAELARRETGVEAADLFAHPSASMDVSHSGA